MTGAIPIVADVDRESQNITADTIRRVISPRTKAIIAVHLAGWPCDMDPIQALAKEANAKVIEDCAQAHGARYKGRPVGSMGDVAAFSFCQDKIITTGGEGGILLTNCDDVAEKAWSFKDHGKNFLLARQNQISTGFRWLHDSFGTNWRITEMQAAIGRAALAKLDGYVQLRRRNARLLTQRFAQFPALRVTTPPDSVEHSYYKYYTFVRPQSLARGWDRDRIMAAVCAEGIPCSSGSCSEIYLEKAFQDLRPLDRLRIARELGETSLMFLVHPNLTEQDLMDTADAVAKVLKVATSRMSIAA
jgi:dTDP-4-amino-4,6-dideoxygalactose transaminase